ncbi:MAG: hypothetical protein FWD03_01050 [Defluviitaleaceae bacterium]|nr:hypothetical protein [Defluviitaleaceae bacterium]
MKYKLTLGLLLIFIFVSACAASNSEDAERFKHEHEILNDQATPDGEHTHKTMHIPANNPVVYVDGEGARDIIASGTGIIYMGFPECPWCRVLIPILLDAVQEAGWRGNVYHYNGRADRDFLRLDDYGEIEVVEPGEPIYHELVAMLFDYLGPYVGLYDDDIRRIYFPTTVFVRDGNITSVHLGTLPTHINGREPLNEADTEELKNALIQQINALQ